MRHSLRHLKSDINKTIDGYHRLNKECEGTFNETCFKQVHDAFDSEKFDSISSQAETSSDSYCHRRQIIFTFGYLFIWVIWFMGTF